jgi:hypothetical protein
MATEIIAVVVVASASLVAAFMGKKQEKRSRNKPFQKSTESVKIAPARTKRKELTHITIDPEVVLKTLEKMPAAFYTREFAQHPDMVAGHPDLCKAKNWNAHVAICLKKLCDTENAPLLDQVGTHPKMGARWHKWE